MRTRVQLLAAAGTLAALAGLALALSSSGNGAGAASIAWAAALLLWLSAYWPALSDPRRGAHERCD